MICKRCETAVSENDKRCPNCGMSLRLYTNNRFWLAALVVILIIIISAVYIMYNKFHKDLPPAAIIPVQTNPPAQSKNDDRSDVYDTESNDAAKETPLPEFKADPNKSESEIEQLVQNVASTAAKYCAAYGETNEFVSKNGYLYDFPAGMYITAKDLLEVEGFNAVYADEDVMIFYIKAGDMPIGITDGIGPDQLTVFAAFPYNNGCIVSNDGSLSVVTDEKMKEILNSYNTDHGRIRRVFSDSETFEKVLLTLENSPGLNGPLDIRNMSEDDKYISAVVSPKSNSILIREFVLEKSGNSCIILVNNIEEQWQKFVAINSVAPDINLELIPAYNLRRNMKGLKSDFSELLKSMVTSGVIPRNSGDPVFISGNTEFVFMEFADGIRILAHNDDTHNEWKVYQVLQYEDAIMRMNEIAKFNPPPYFLIKQS